jgi:thymidylate synthase ThyX
MNKIIIENLYGKVKDNMSNKDNIAIFKSYMNRYFDKNSEILFDVKLTKQLLFSDMDKSIVFELTGLSIDEVKKTIKESKFIKDSWQIMNEPLNIAFVLEIKYFYDNKMQNELEMTLIYYSCYFYSSLFYKFFPYAPNENIMNYTINNLSNKYKIKKLGSLFKCLEDTVKISHEKYATKLDKGTDEDLAQYILCLKTRVNEFIKNIANEFYKNEKEKNYINFEEDDYSEDNYHIADNNSFAIKRITDKVLLNLTQNGPDMRFVQAAANMNQISVSVFRNAILNIMEKSPSEIRELINLILQVYLFDDKNSVDEIRSKKFIVHAIDLYKKSNTNDELVIKIKSILDQWLKENSDNYAKTQRKATLTNFRRALYYFFIFTIQNYSI